MRKAAVGFGVVAALVAGALLWAYYSPGVILKFVLEHYGPDVLGAPVKVAEVRLSAQTGEGVLHGLEIGSPQGFTAPRSARFGEVRIALDPATLTGDVIRIREIRVDAPAITFERGKGGHNLDAIQKNIDAYVERSAGGAQGKPAAARAQAKRRFTVDRFTIRFARVTMTGAALRGQGLTFEIPDIDLRDVGKPQGGLRASELANVVAGAIVGAIARRMLTNVELLRKGGIEGAVDALKGILR
jgi:hypothetical protein